MSTQDVRADSGLTLEELNKLVGNKERVLGPLAKIGNDGTKTVLTLDTTPPPPQKNAVITTGQVPAGGTKIDSGKVFVSGQLKDATAFRPS